MTQLKKHDNPVRVTMNNSKVESNVLKVLNPNGNIKRYLALYLLRLI